MTNPSSTSTNPEPGYEWEADVLGVPPVPVVAAPDIVAGPETDALHGLTLDYTYSSGRHYRLLFDHDHRVSFEMPDDDQPPPDFVAPLLPYRARVIKPGLVLLHWIIKKGPIHVALTIDLDDDKLHVAAMMPPNRWEFFDTAEIHEVTRA